jgi:hypothetical protein
MSEKKPLTPTRKDADPVVKRSGPSEIDAFIRQVQTMAPVTSGTGRLILALDATMSLAVQLVYFRGFDECRASRFVADTTSLKNLMTKIDCRGGATQIGKVFSHALKETEKGKVNALVYIGDAMEENVDLLAQKAGQLGLRGVPIFAFQEGHDPATETAFREFARLSKGAWFRFNSSSADTLAKLLSAVAVYATGGLKALEARGRPEDRLLIAHLGSSGGGG